MAAISGAGRSEPSERGRHVGPLEQVPLSSVAVVTIPAIIYLIGYRGTGKSTVARLLAERLGWQSVDADAELEKHFGKSIRQIFAEEGEAGFRDKEAQILEALSRRQQCVVATGGGVVLRPENRARLQQGFVVWLRAEPEVIWRRLEADATTAQRRPNLAQGGLAEIEEVLAQRQPFYEECAQFIFNTSRHAPEAIAEQIAALAR
jgi:shikimate kinase